MMVIRRMVDRRRAYTAIFLKGEPPKIFPTSDAEHARILQVYKQDRPIEGIINDFSEDVVPAAVAVVPVAAVAAAKSPGREPRGKKVKVNAVAKKKGGGQGRAGGARRSRRGYDGPLWIVPVEAGEPAEDA